MADAQRWGTDEQGQPRKVQTSTVYGTLETKVPIMAKTMQGWPYCIITEDPHLLIAKMEHPQFADKIMEQGDDGVADTQFERMARIGALQGNSASYQLTDTYQFYVEEHHGWFRPAMFMDKSLDSAYMDEEHMEEVDSEGNPRTWTLRDALKEAFPNGAYCNFIGKQYTGSHDGTMEDELAVDFPYAGDGMSRKAIMDDAVVIQDRFNDDMNAYAEVKDFGWPSTWINQEYSDLAAVNDQTASPYAFRALKQRPARDSDMEKQFYREQDPMIPPSFQQSTEYMATQLLQFILAIPSAVQGAGMPDQKTASGYTAALQQALGQLGVNWIPMQRLMACVYRQAALAASKCSDENQILVVPSPKGAVTLNMGDLGKGHFLAHPDQDSGYPESTVQKRATLMSILTLASQNPQVLMELLQSPDNWDFIFRTFGIAELVIPEAKARRKQLAEIELLLQQSPTGPTPEEIAATMEAPLQTEGAGPVAAPAMPPPLHSSIPVGKYDYHEFEFEECREFLSDWPKVQQQIIAGNQAGLENIMLHMQEHEVYIQQAQQAQAQMQMAMAAAKPAGKPPGKDQQQPAQQEQPQAAA
jgi:hypothetical protein